ncbi:MAG: dual specificity protein phosphatase family protein [Planctomycetaceae bacterium]|nr:dual specificity protein phosphatase family protein [Planctomycetaceae bacterium]
MKHGVSLAMLALAMAALAAVHRGAYWLLLWPSASFAWVAAGYFRFGPGVFGKSPRGVLSPVTHAVLLPYLLFSWMVWHLLRVVSRETAYNQLTDRLLIGRRLLSHELPAGIDHVIDLTCEFNEPHRLRERSYRSFPILDGADVSAEELRCWAEEVAALPGTVYIHCAQGHGRTGMFAAAVLMASGKAASPDEALRMVIEARPGVRLSSQQLQTLRANARGKQTGRSEAPESPHT